VLCNYLKLKKKKITYSPNDGIYHHLGYFRAAATVCSDRGCGGRQDCSTSIYYSLVINN
jgi:hypothetical protein